MKWSRTIALAPLLAAPMLLTMAGCETTHQPMTYERCSTARLCTLRGMLTPRQVGLAWMGELAIPDGRCVTVSMPAQMMMELQRSGPVEVTVRGRRYDIPQGTQAMTVEGRTLGIGQCGEFLLFVLD